MKRSHLQSSSPLFSSFLLLISAVEVRRCKMHIHVGGNTALVSNYHLVAPCTGSNTSHLLHPFS